jgi:hypothetical protein
VERDLVEATDTDASARRIAVAGPLLPDTAQRALALQRSVGNRATARALQGRAGQHGFAAGGVRASPVLSRAIGWPEASSGPNSGKTSPNPGVDRYPIYDPALGGNKDPNPLLTTTPEKNDNRAIVLVGQESSGPVQVLLHFHGLQGVGNPGYRNVGGVRDEDKDRDRSDEQFSKSLAEGDTKLVIVMPQGNAGADFGDAATAPEAYVDRVLGQLASDGGPSLSRSDLIVSGWSAGGNSVAKMANAEAASGTTVMKSVFLYEGVNNFLSKDGVTMGGRDKIDTFLALVARHLLADVSMIVTLFATSIGLGLGIDDYLAHSFRFRAYYDANGAYVAAHDLLDQGIRQLFGEPVSKAELARQKLRLPPTGLALDTTLAANITTVLPAMLAVLPTSTVSELRSHYQVIKVDDSPKGKVDDSATAPHLHSLGHNNIIGSGALLDSLRNTRSLR